MCWCRSSFQEIGAISGTTRCVPVPPEVHNDKENKVPWQCPGCETGTHIKRALSMHCNTRCACGYNLYYFRPRVLHLLDNCLCETIPFFISLITIFRQVHFFHPLFLSGQPKASATKSVLDDDAGSARDSPGGGGKGKETRRYKATRMTATASKYISCVCMCTDYFIYISGQPKASATKSVLDDDAGSARDSPGGGGKGKETRRYKATRMTATASKYISCVFMCTDYFIYILGQPKASATKSVLDDDAGSARD